MAVLLKNNAGTTLSGDINNSVTSIGVASSASFPSSLGSDHFYATIDDGTNVEIVKVTAVSGTTWTVVRAQDNTSAQSFSAGDNVQLRLNVKTLEELVSDKVTLEDLDVTSDSGTIAIDLDSETLTIGGTSNEIETSATGNAVTIGIPAAAQITTSLGVGGGSTNGVVIEQGAIKIKNGGTQSHVDFYCESNNAHYLRLQAPAHANFSGNPTVTLPNTAGTVALTSSDITGNAATATALATARTIGGTSFDGTANISVALADTATALATARTIHGVSFDGTANIDLSEVVQDTVGAMFSSNTETGITATYEDGDGTIDLVIGSDAIVNSMIADDAIDSAQIADDAVDSAQIADGAIDTVHIANDQVTGDKLANDITIANDLTVAGNLSVTGTTTQTGAIVSDDNFTGLTNANSANITDFGFFGKYVESSTTKYAGLFYDASTDNTFRLFADTQTEPAVTVNTGATGYAAANLIVNNLTGTLTTAAQPNITSLGTLTALTGGTGDFNWDSNTLVVDSSTNRVGILNAAPDVTLDIGSANDAIHVPVGTTAQRPASPAAGYFRYNSTTGGFEGYTDAWGAIAGGGGGGTAPSIDTMTGDGSDTTLTLSTSPVNENATFVTIDGVLQHKSTYSVSGTTLTFSEAPPDDTAVECITLNATSSTTANILQDADSDTKIQVEESSDEDTIRMDIAGTEVLTLTNSAMTLKGTTPTLTIGDAGAEDTKIVFDGNAQDFYIGLDDSADDLVIGKGSTVGTTPAISIDENLSTTFASTVAVQNTFSITDSTTSAFLQTGSNLVQFGGSTDAPLIFYTNNAERMRVTSAGDLYFGQTSGSVTDTGTIIQANGKNFQMASVTSETITHTYNNTSSSGAKYIISFRQNNTEVGSIEVGSSSTALVGSSDYRLKENVDYTWDATTRLKQLKPCRFNWIADDTNTLIDGFLAHEVQDIVPEAVRGEKDAVYTAEEEANELGTEGAPKLQGIDQSKLIPLLVKTIQELEARIKTLEDA